MCTTLCVCAHLQKTLIELYTDVLNLLTEFDAKLNRKDGKFVNTLPQVQSTLVFIHTWRIYTCIHIYHVYLYYHHFLYRRTCTCSFFLGKVIALGVLCCFALFVCLKGHDQNVSAYSRRSVNSGGAVNLTFTYVYVRTYVVGAYWIAALCNLISTPWLSSIIIVYAASIRKSARARRRDRAPLTLLASFFLPSHLSFKHCHHFFMYMYIHVHTCICEV